MIPNNNRIPLIPIADIHLCRKDAIEFVKALEIPAKPNERFLKAAHAYKKLNL